MHGAIAEDARARLRAVIEGRNDVRIQVVEMPPGPPVLGGFLFFRIDRPFFCRQTTKNIANPGIQIECFISMLKSNGNQLSP